MNIKDFLIENYIWILIIILITIITIIGFLADKKKNGKKSEETGTPQPMPNPQMGNMAPMQYNGQEQLMQNQMNNNMAQGMNVNNFNNQMTQPVNQVPNMQNVPNQGNMNGMVQEQPMMNNQMPIGMEQMTNPNPVENVAPATPAEPMYQPLSEQTPVIAPRPVPNFTNDVNNSQEMPMQQMNNNVMNQNVVPPMTPNYNQPVQPMEPMVQNQPMNYNMPNQMPQQPMDNGYGNMSNFQPNNTTIPEPVNVVPTPQPINPQPIMQPMNNNVMNQSVVPPMAPNYNQPMPQQNFNQQPVQEPAPQPMPNQPITFVYGPQNNNQ